MPEFIKEKQNKKKVFADVLVHELMKYLMVQYGKINEPTKKKAKA